MRRGGARRSSERHLTLHIGTPKSGTTYLQARLRAVRPELTERGILYPGAGYLPRGGLNQQAAMYGLAGSEVRWIGPAVRANGVRLLERVQAEVARHGGHTLISAEGLASFEADRVGAVVEALGHAPHQVAVVITARDLGRLLTSVWQENIKNGATQDLPEYLASVARLRGEPANAFWTAYRLPELVDRWAGVVGPERVVLVTTPPRRGRHELWPRFSRAARLGEPPAVPAGGGPVGRAESNISLTTSQVELLRQMNAILDRDQVDHAERQRLRARLLSAWLVAGAADGHPPGLDPEWLPTLRMWAADDIAALREREGSGLRIVGDLAELEPAPRIVTQGQAPSPTVSETAQDLLAVLRSHAEPSVSGSR